MQNCSSQSAQLAVSSWLCPSLLIHCTGDSDIRFGRTSSPGQSVPSCILQRRGCSLYTHSFSCCNSQHQHTASQSCLNADGSADLLGVAVAQVTGQQTGSCRAAGAAIASDQAVQMLYAQLHAVLRCTGTLCLFSLCAVICPAMLQGRSQLLCSCGARCTQCCVLGGTVQGCRRKGCMPLS
jgi:hypothetical protein